MKKLVYRPLFCGGTVLLYLLLIMSTAGEQLAGVWLTAKRDSQIQIVENTDGTFSGKIIWTAPNVRSYVGVQVLKGVVYNKGADSYTCPWVYDPKMGVTASGVANISHDTLYIRAHKGFLSKTEFFTRVKR